MTAAEWFAWAITAAGGPPFLAWAAVVVALAIGVRAIDVRRAP